MIASAVRVALTAFLIGLTTTTIRAATAPPDLPAPYADPGAYRVLDTQTERYGFGANQVAVTRYKVESLATGKGETVSLDAAGRVLTEAASTWTRANSRPSIS